MVKGLIFKFTRVYVDTLKKDVNLHGNKYVVSVSPFEMSLMD